MVYCRPNLLRTGEFEGGGAPQSLTVLASNNAPYIVGLTILSSASVPYVVSNTVLASNNTPYNV